MKRFFRSFLSLFGLGLLVFTGLRAQPVNSVAFGSTVSVWSGHTTVRERVDAGVDERIELWNRTWIVSPSGQVYQNNDHWGFNAPDGYSAATITFNKAGRWIYWASDAGSIDSWVYGDGPYDWYMWPHNPPNGVGYGGAGRRITAYIDVQPAPPSNVAPTISWNSAPGAVASGQSYTVSAHGHDDDGNLSQVNVWKNGAPFAFAGGGNGTDGDSGNPTSDTGPATITFTAQAVDSNGATSSTITHTVTVSAPNNAPTAAISGSTALKTNETGSWNFSAADADGNLSQWRFYASTNGNPQWSSISGSFVSGSYSRSFSTPGSYIWKVDVQDSAGVSRSASITVNVTAPPPVSAAITASPTSATAPGSATISWSASNATSVSVSGNGVSSSATSGSRTVSGLPAGTYTYTIVAQGANGPATKTATLTVTAPPSVTGSISASPTTAIAPGSVTISWSTTNSTAVLVSGPGLASSAASGARTVAGLGVGTHTFSLTAQGYGGPVIRMAEVTVNPAPTFTLTTAATGGGNVTPGGTYSAGSVVTVTAAPDASHRFTGWTGDASGTASTTAVTLDRAKFVQANFAAKTAQTITFDPPGDHGLASPPFTLTASATSGLPVSFSLVSGPAILTDSSVQVTGAGPVTVQANQPGDAFFLPAAPVNQSFNVTAAATLKYRGQSRTLLRGETTREAPPFVLEKP